MRLDDAEEEESADDVFSAAYENVTYKDSTADGNEGSMMEAGAPGRDFDDLAQEADAVRSDLQCF